MAWVFEGHDVIFEQVEVVHAWRVEIVNHGVRLVDGNLVEYHSVVKRAHSEVKQNLLSLL